MPTEITLYRKKFSVLSHEADIHNSASLYSMSNYLQEAARSHAERLHLGIELLRKQQKFWVLTRMIIQISDYPAMGSEVEVHTWPKGIDRLFALRDFELWQGKEKICSATSSWALLDLAHRRPSQVHEIGEFMFEREGIHAIESRPQKLPTPKFAQKLPSHFIRYSELDLNGHVNNTRYITWMMDTFPISYHNTHQVSRVQTNFLAEVFPDQELTILREEKRENEFLFEVRNENEKPLFRGELIFKTITKKHR